MSRSVWEMLRPAVLIGALLSATALLGACNTMEGFGEDMQAGGQAIEEEAQ
ncbi:entericidin A/B family lipoprotein [Azospirillum halopraeferens]|uniref:entericidin A/B family lipoprotein n=1 Tax=Azospirillum halopraeferens TaxID=34010 RepID=UPI000A05F7C3|nr:entericidin A/B family lipoprotein [Azospirillum halopraeferens]